jgi:uncharacterized protein YuzE
MLKTIHNVFLDRTFKPLDDDAEGNLVGIDIDHASQKLNLRELVTNHIPPETKAQS